LSAPTASDLPPGLAVAPEMPTLWPDVRLQTGIAGFVRRHPTVAVGGLLLLAVFAPYLGTVDPTALATARRTRPPSIDNWFGTDMLGRDIYSRVVYGARVSLTVDAILRRDYPIIQGLVLLFSFVYVLINLAIDLVYKLLDPRIRY